MNYGKRLDQALTHAKKSRRQLAQAIEQSPQSIGMVITGKTERLSTTASAKAALFLRVDHNWLVTGKGSMTAATAAPPPDISPDAAYLGYWIDKITDRDARERVAHACVSLILRELAVPASQPTPEPEPASKKAPAARPKRSA
jgi:hypothetical protein